VSVDPNGGLNATVSGRHLRLYLHGAELTGNFGCHSATVDADLPGGDRLSVTVIDGPRQDTSHDIDGSLRRTAASMWTPIAHRILRRWVARPRQRNCSTFDQFPHQLQRSWRRVASDREYVVACESADCFRCRHPLHVSWVPAGCSPTAGTHVPHSFDVGDGVWQTSASHRRPSIPARSIWIRPNAIISVLPGDAGIPFSSPNLTADCTHGCFACHDSSRLRPRDGRRSDSRRADVVTIYVQPDPFPTLESPVLCRG